jgi:hypothetical protein
MDSDKRLAEHLEKLRVTLLALETYMAQVRDLIAVGQALLAERAGGPPAPKPRKSRPKRIGAG